MNALTTMRSHIVLLDYLFEISSLHYIHYTPSKTTTSVSYEAPRMTQPHVLSKDKTFW